MNTEEKQSPTVTVTTDQTTAGGLMGFSRQILDNVGLRVDLKAWPFAPLYVLARDAKFGRGWLSRLWAQRVRPWLCPARQVLIDEAYAAAVLQRRQWFLNTVTEAKETD